jgi:hypothetical protein
LDHFRRDLFEMSVEKSRPLVRQRRRAETQFRPLHLAGVVQNGAIH